MYIEIKKKYFMFNTMAFLIHFAYIFLLQLNCQQWRLFKAENYL